MPETLLELAVTERIQHPGGVVSIALTHPDGKALPSFTAGAHIDLHLPTGLVRQYSLMNDPSERFRYRIGVLLDPATRGGSALVHSKLLVGERVRTSSPRNHFPLQVEAEPSILIGGGIGVTPMLAMAHELNRQGRDFSLHYCTRTPDGAAFLDELRASPFHYRVREHHDDDGRSVPFSPERDLPPATTGAHCYVCGPSGFMDWVINTARSLGYPETALHREYFSADIDRAGAAFEIHAARSDLTVQVAEGQSIAEALRGAGIAVEVSCEEGVCGTCLVDVLDGVPDHRDVYLTDAEKQANDQMLVCCSRAQTSRLVLDI